MSEITAMDDGIRDDMGRDDNEQEAVPQTPARDESERHTPGGMLRAARLARNYSVAELCSQSMLTEHMIEALENNNFEALSQPVFARGYYRKCAKVLEMDEDALMAAYAAIGGVQSSTGPASVGGVNIVPADVTPDRRRVFGTVFLIVLLLIAALAVYLFWQQRSETPVSGGGQSAITLAEEFNAPMGQPQTTQTVSSLASALQASASQASAASASADDSKTNTRTQQGAAVQEQPAQDTTAATDSVDTAPASTATNTTDDAAPADTASATQTPAQAQTGTAVATALTLVFDERSWVNVHDATGAQLLVGIYESTTRQLDGVPPYDVVIGYAPGVDVRFAGEAVEFQVAGNNTARFTVGSENG